MTQTSELPSLLLLPAPPQPATRIALNTAYRPSIAAALNHITDNTDEPSTLIVALTCPALTGSIHSHSRTVKWKYSQSLLAGIYVIIASVCAELDIATDVGASAPGSVDVRVVLVDHESGRRYSTDQPGEYKPNSTVVLDLASFATKVHPWQTIFHPSSEAGHELQKAYLALAEGRQKLLQSQLVAVDSGMAMSVPVKAPETGQIDVSAVDGYGTVCLGGTFDHLHPGHKLLLHATALLLQDSQSSNADGRSELIVGISGDALLTKKQFAEELQPWNVRARSVISFLSTILNCTTIPATSSTTLQEQNGEIQVLMRDNTILVRCVNIPDPFGPTITEEGVQAIVVSAETRSGGSAINDKRTEKGWRPLDVYEIDVLDAGGIEEEGQNQLEEQSFVSKISSTTIRRQRAEARATQGL